VSDISSVKTLFHCIKTSYKVVIGNVCLIFHFPIKTIIKEKASSCSCGHSVWYCECVNWQIYQVKKRDAISSNVVPVVGQCSPNKGWSMEKITLAPFKTLSSASRNPPLLFISYNNQVLLKGRYCCPTTGIISSLV